MENKRGSDQTSVIRMAHCNLYLGSLITFFSLRASSVFKAYSLQPVVDHIHRCHPVAKNTTSIKSINAGNAVQCICNASSVTVPKLILWCSFYLPATCKSNYTFEYTNSLSAGIDFIIHRISVVFGELTVGGYGNCLKTHYSTYALGFMSRRANFLEIK